MSNTKVIDHLPEDQLIPSQQFALVSIVGPGMKGKCDVYGLKVRGISSTLDEAKGMSKRIMEYDNMFDIYTVPVGKFFPLDVSKDKEIPVEYQNEELNKLMKNYMESTQNANREWNKQKNTNLEKASSKESTQEKEHIYTVYNTTLNVVLDIEKLEKELSDKKQRLVDEQKRLKDDYTQEEQDTLQKFLAKELSEEESKRFLN